MAVRLATAGEAEQARETLDDVRDALAPIRKAASDDPLASAQVDALETHVGSLAGRLEEPEPTRADRLLADGIVAGKPVGDSLRSVVVDARDWALGWLEHWPSTHCGTSEQLTCLSLPEDGDEELLHAAEVVLAAVRQILLDCLCTAVNPPCVSCEDAAVVLATVTVEGCDVTEICNSVRRYALTGTALRYWLPAEWLYSKIEDACCGDADPRKFLASFRQAACALAAACKRDPWIEGGREPDARAAVAPADDAAPAAEESQAEKDRRLLTMLNSQVQTMQAKVRKLERAAEEGAHG